MVSQVDYGRFVGLGFVTDVDAVVVGKSINGFSFKFAGEAHLAVLGNIGNLQTLIAQLFDIKHTVLETLYSAMQAVSEIVNGQLVFYSVQTEFALIDAITVTADKSTKIGGIVQVILNVVKPQDHIAELTLLIGDHNRNNAGSVIHHTHFHAVGIFHNVQIVLFTIDFGLEVNTVEFCLGGIVAGAGIQQ